MSLATVLALLAVLAVGGYLLFALLRGEEL
jgi:hypothetical protein